jgi:ElaB/YqjD/DUF883 family membrane-anchored ribosome-binding protein
MVTRTAKAAAPEDAAVHDGANGSSDSRTRDDIDAAAERLEALEEQLRDAGERMLESARTLTAAASKQMQTHPLTAFGVAFVAGLAVARLLRR